MSGGIRIRFKKERCAGTEFHSDVDTKSGPGSDKKGYTGEKNTRVRRVGMGGATGVGVRGEEPCSYLSLRGGRGRLKATLWNLSNLALGLSGEGGEHQPRICGEEKKNLGEKSDAGKNWEKRDGGCYDPDKDLMWFGPEKGGRRPDALGEEKTKRTSAVKYLRSTQRDRSETVLYVRRRACRSKNIRIIPRSGIGRARRRKRQKKTMWTFVDCKPISLSRTACRSMKGSTHPQKVRREGWQGSMSGKRAKPWQSLGWKIGWFL